ncbi:MAG: IS5/IS1182 family transposase, partial [Actinokineospora sp.]
RANSLLKTTFKALRRHRGCPWRIGDIVAAALVLLHHEHHHTT